MIEDVSQVMTKHITSILSGVIGEYTIYKETHDTIMGLPCVRKLQERILDLEQCGGMTASASASSSSIGNNRSREEEVAQLQSAIADLNRYIHALESKVDMKSVSSGDAGETQNKSSHHEEESVRLEIHEADEGEGEGDEGEGDHCETNVETSTHKNVIITTEALEDTEAEEAEEAEEEETEEEEAEEAEEAVTEEAEAEEEETEEAEDAEAQPEQEDAEAEPEEAEEAEETEDAEDAEAEPEQEDAEADAEAEEQEEEAEAQPEQEEAEEETEEVEEVKIKGKTYFTTDPQNGIIYACVDDDVGDEVGVFKNGVAVFNKGKK
jgi:hypothetical protein